MPTHIDRRYVEEPKQGLFGKAKYSNVDLNTSSLKMYWGVAKRFGGQELWRELLQVRAFGLLQTGHRWIQTMHGVGL